MIQIDMKKPRRCFDCPGSYRVQFGEYKDQDICSFLNHQGIPPEDCIVNLFEIRKDCPMKEVRQE